MPEVRRRRGQRGRIPAGGRFIGRPSRWGNPFEIGRDGDRETVIRVYRKALFAGELPVTVEDVRHELAGLDLFCYCAPLPCHGDVLLEVANAPG